jgi:hypothetical protein
MLDVAMTDELERIWMKQLWIEVLCQHFPGKTEENNEKPQSG